MSLLIQTRWRITYGCLLVVAGAGAALGIRLAMGTSAAAGPPPPAIRPAAAVRQVSAETKSLVESLLAPEQENKLARWMEDRPAEMMAYIDTLEDRELAMQLAARFVKAVRNPHHDLLLDWISRQKDGRIAALVFQGVLPRLSREDPEQSISLSFSLGDGEEALAAREALFTALPMARRMELLERQKPEERASLLSRQAASLGDRAPQPCLEMISQLPPSTHRSEALAGLMKTWANGTNVFRLADPVSAVESAMAVADPALRQESLKLAVQEWSDKHPDIASRWITQLSTGPERDAAIGGLVTRLAPADPASAADWASAISDEALRQETLGWLKTLPPTTKKDEP